MQHDQRTFHVDIAHQNMAGTTADAVRIAFEAAARRNVDLWLPSLGPSPAVWRRFSCESFEWHEFCRRYRQELGQRERPCERLRALACKRSLVLMYEKGDEQHNVAVAMKQHLEELECRRRYAAGWIVGGLTWPVRGEIERCGGLWFPKHKAWTMPDYESWKFIQSLRPGDF